MEGLFKWMQESLGVPVELNVFNAVGYADNVVAALFNQSGEMPFAVNETMHRLMERYLGIYFFDANFGDELAASLSATRLLAYIESALLNKVRLFEGERVEQPWRHLRFSFFSAHDTTLAAFLAVLGQPQLEGSGFASQCLLELVV